MRPESGPDRCLRPTRSASRPLTRSLKALLDIPLARGWYVLAAALILGISACTPAPDPTTAPKPTDTTTPVPAATATETQPPTELPEATATAVPTESGEFISPYTPSAPTGSGASLDPVVLRLNFQDGAVYRFRMLTTQDLSQTFDGQTFDISTVTGFEYTYTVTRLDPDGSAWVDVIYTRALYETDSAFLNISYDSADPPGQIPEGAEGFAAIVGIGFSMRIGPDGDIQEIEGLDAMYDQMLAELDLPDPEMRQAFELTFREQFGDQAMKDQLGNLLFEFPEGSLQVGDSWTSTEETTVMLPIVVETTYTLLGFDENTALIEVRSEISTGTQEGGLDLGLFAFDFTLTGSQEGRVQVDLKTGLTNSISDQTLRGEMTLVADGEEITVPINILQTVQIESVQLAP